jgi:hypothetical protein
MGFSFGMNRTRVVGTKPFSRRPWLRSSPGAYTHAGINSSYQSRGCVETRSITSRRYTYTLICRRLRVWTRESLASVRGVFPLATLDKFAQPMDDHCWIIDAMRPA